MTTRYDTIIKDERIAIRDEAIAEYDVELAQVKNSKEIKTNSIKSEEERTEAIKHTKILKILTKYLRAVSESLEQNAIVKPNINNTEYIKAMNLVKENLKNSIIITTELKRFTTGWCSQLAEESQICNMPLHEVISVLLNNKLPSHTINAPSTVFHGYELSLAYSWDSQHADRKLSINSGCRVMVNMTVPKVDRSCWYMIIPECLKCCCVLV